MNIFVVDDEIDWADKIQKRLQEEGYIIVAVAYSAQVARSMIPDLPTGPLIATVDGLGNGGEVGKALADEILRRPQTGVVSFSTILQGWKGGKIENVEKEFEWAPKLLAALERVAGMLESIQ
jgi:DNA-binding NtrC family response regulator